MSKSILGDDPFAPKPATPAAAAAPAKETDKPHKAEAAATGKRAAAAEPAAKGKAKAKAAKGPAAKAAKGATTRPRKSTESAARDGEVAAAANERDAARTAPESTPSEPIADEATAPSFAAPREEEAASAAADADAASAVAHGVFEDPSPAASALPAPDAPRTPAELYAFDDELAPAVDDDAPSRRVGPGPLWRTVRALSLRDRALAVDDFGRDDLAVRRLDRWLGFLYQRWFRVEAEGLAHIPDHGRALLVANHSGALPYDAGMLMHAVRHEHEARREVRPLVEDFVFHMPFLGTLMNRLGGVRACPENATRLLEADELCAVFPEGTKGIGKLYRERYQLQRFGRGGFVKLALATDTPIVPTAIVGAEEIHPMLARLEWPRRMLGIPYIPVTPTFPWLGPLGLVPLPTKWRIVFGAPLYFGAEYGPEAASDRVLVNRLAEQVRQRIQEMVDGVVERRASIFR